MRGWLCAPIAAVSTALAPAPASADPGAAESPAIPYSPPFVEHTDWVQWAEFAQPGKTSWNLEPWRPVVDDAAMLAADCNPGGEEPF